MITAADKVNPEIAVMPTRLDATESTCWQCDQRSERSNQHSASHRRSQQRR